MEGFGGRNDSSLEFELISHFSDFVWFIFISFSVFPSNNLSHATKEVRISQEV